MRANFSFIHQPITMKAALEPVRLRRSAALTLGLSLAALLTPAAAYAQGRPGRGERVAPAAVDPVVAFVDEQIRQGWQDNEVQPSPAADDAEWLRRVYLDLIGQIPPAALVDAFLSNREEDKRARVVTELLSHPALVRHWTTVWTNLLIGRQTPRRTSREGMEKFLREAFARNRPWNEIVYDLLTAEGHFQEQGAVNFLLAQLDGPPNREDYTVEATARVTRLFLGTQVQCTQCHNHPFNDWKQDQFWQMDSFFKQIRRVNHRRLDAATGRQVDDYSELVWQDFAGPVYYEKRSGVMEVAYPIFASREVPAAPDTNRREELARLLAREDADHQLARAMVNRMWGHFFSYGFTRPVDDMGPHNPPSHPEVLDHLTEEFVECGYNLQQLMQWITATEAYQLTSRFNDSNRLDDPASGEVPLFSHMYVKPLTAEQLYDSLVVATQGDDASSAGYQRAQQERRQWMRDFLTIFGGNEEDEPTLFSGTIPQALLMMNGPLVRNALRQESGSSLSRLVGTDPRQSDADRIRQFYLTVLSRLPTRRELSSAQSLVSLSRDKWAAYQDLYWVLLNSNEFVFNH
jgi:hypothetical protein